LAHLAASIRGVAIIPSLPAPSQVRILFSSVSPEPDAAQLILKHCAVAARKRPPDLRRHETATAFKADSGFSAENSRERYLHSLPLESLVQCWPLGQQVTPPL